MAKNTKNIRSKQKHIPTFVGLIIIAVAIAIIFGGVFAYQYFAVHKIDSQLQNIKLQNKTVSIDSSCDGEKDPYYNVGFGIENNYEGDIKQGMHVKIVLSCNHQKLIISGAVNQIIKSSDLSQYNNGENIDLADLSSGSAVVDVNSDYNFDGYNDLASVVSSGEGRDSIDTYIIFLYDPKINQFVYNDELSSIVNIQTDSGCKQIKGLASACLYPPNPPKNECPQFTNDNARFTDYWKWLSGHLQFEKWEEWITD